jgi:L-tyrosine C(3)-methyltransferase
MAIVPISARAPTLFECGSARAGCPNRRSSLAGATPSLGRRRGRPGALPIEKTQPGLASWVSNCIACLHFKGGDESRGEYVMDNDYVNSPARDDNATSFAEQAEATDPIANAALQELTLFLHGHAAFQYLHAGCALEVFERLRRASDFTVESLGSALGLSRHAARVFLFGLRSLGLVVERGGELRNGLAIDLMFERGDWNVFRATVFFHAEIAYPGERDFITSLREGRNAGLSFLPGTGVHLYERLSADPRLKKVFYDYMSLWTRHVLKFLLHSVNFDAFSTILDVGGGDGTAAVAIAEAYARPLITVMELAVNELLIRQSTNQGLQERVRLQSGDMFSTAWPAGQDCVLFLHQLVIWNRAENLQLLRRAFESLRPGGTVLIVSSMADPDEAGPRMAALDSAYFVAVAAGEGMIYPWTEYEALLSEVGFEGVTFQRFPTWTPHGIVAARRSK